MSNKDITRGINAEGFEDPRGVFPKKIITIQPLRIKHREVLIETNFTMEVDINT